MTEDPLLGAAVDISGAVTGLRRHESDTEEMIQLTLYDQDGTLRDLPVRRTRDMEIFQEWLRRFDRYTTTERKEDAVVQE